MTSESPDVAVHRRDDRSRYEIEVDGAVIGFADFEARGDAVVFPHTVIDPSRRGQGFAPVLVRAALDDVRAAGRTVVPACWYVRQFIDAHPAYADLVDV
jgi:predicted GNAT family acetyltransferase